MNSYTYNLENLIGKKLEQAEKIHLSCMLLGSLSFVVTTITPILNPNNLFNTTMSLSLGLAATTLFFIIHNTHYKHTQNKLKEMGTKSVKEYLGSEKCDSEYKKMIIESCGFSLT